VSDVGLKVLVRNVQVIIEAEVFVAACLTVIEVDVPLACDLNGSLGAAASDTDMLWPIKSPVIWTFKWVDFGNSSHDINLIYWETIST
jgi:hypothetical protein